MILIEIDMSARAVRLSHPAVVMCDDLWLYAAICSYVCQRTEQKCSLKEIVS
jgi:hypothetical protein